MRLLAASISTFVMLLVLQVGCSVTSPFGAKSTEEDEGSEADEDDELADEPTQVSGAFLTVLCDADGFAVDEKYNIERDPVIACIIKKDDGTRFTGALTSIAAEVFQNEGQSLSAQASIAPTPPWHFYVKTAQDDRKKITAGTFQISTGDGTNTVSTKTFDYKWYDDPLIKSLVAALIGQPEPKKVRDGMAMLLRADNPYRMEHIIFASNALFQGNVTAQAADAYCQEEGDALLQLYEPASGVPQFTWRALIGTNTASARMRIPIVGSVYTVYGSMVSQSRKAFREKYPERNEHDLASLQAMFWDEDLSANVAVTQTGKLVNLFDKIEGRLQVVDYAWTGAGAGGAQPSPLANCGSWTQTAATGVIGDLMARKAARWINTDTLSCTRHARLMCISARSEVTP